MSDAHQIEFPCRYPIKIIVATAEGQVDEVVEILRRHSPNTTPSDIDPHQSRGGNFVSLRVNLWAEGEDQLQTLYEELLNHPVVRIIL